MGRVSMICRAVALVCLSALASPVHAADLRREDPRDAATLRRVVDLVGKNYVEPSRVDPRRMLWAAAVALDKEIPEVVLESSSAEEPLKLWVAGARRTFSTDSVRSLPSLTRTTREVLQFVNSHRATPAHPNAEYAAIGGMLGALDPHSLLLDPDQARAFESQINSTISGIGIQFDTRGEVPVVIRVIKGGAAAAAGIAVCDRILAIEGRSTVGLTPDEMFQRITGPTDTAVWMTFGRDGVGLVDVILTRSQIKWPSVTGRLLEGGVGCILIDHFSKGTADEVEASIAALKKAGASAWILDMRTNPGGLLSEAIRTASIFVPSGPIVTTLSGREREVSEARPGATEKGPVAVLIGPATASAAEVVAGALQNRNRAVVLGRTSWGKGTVQVLFDNDDGSKLKITIAHYVTPGGVSLQSRGITPDVELLPVPAPRPGRIRLSEPELEREAGLDRAFAAREAVQRSEVSLKYMAATPDREEEVGIARDLLLETRSGKRTETLLLGRAILNDRRGAEEERIVRVLAEAGVDWSSGSSDTPPRLAVRCAQRATVNPEDRVVIDCDVKNDGAGDAFRVYGHAPSLALDLQDQEIVLGRVAASSSRKVTLEGILAKDPAPRITYVPFAFSEQGGAAVESAPLRIETPARARAPEREGPPRPEIRLGPAGQAHETGEGIYHLQATIRDPVEVRDAWVRISNLQARLDGKKVTFSAGPDAGPRDRLELSTDVPLSPGLNEIGVCARGKEAERCETTFVFRLPASLK